MNEKLCEFIVKIFENACKANKSFYNLEDFKYNFKKIYVIEVGLTSETYKYIVKCQSASNVIISEFIYDLHSLEDDEFQIRSRVKAINSIQYKLVTYQSKYDENLNCGKYNLLKVFNDIIGFRIIMNNPPSIAELQSFCETTLDCKVRAIISDKGDYKANHLYTKIANSMLPWEIQIWDIKNRDSNLESHKLYKQGYTNWEKEQSKSNYLNKEVLE